MLITDLSAGQLLLLALPVLPNLWSLNHAFTHEFADPREKSRWMLACVFVPCLAGIAYIAVGRRHALAPAVPERAAVPPEVPQGAVLPEQRDTAASGGAKGTEEAVRPAQRRADGWSFGCPDEEKGNHQ